MARSRSAFLALLSLAGCAWSSMAQAANAAPPSARPLPGSDVATGTDRTQTVARPKPDPAPGDLAGVAIRSPAQLVGPASGSGQADPGSLLLFPEYDNASATLLTVTNTQLDQSALPIEIHWVYVDQAACQATEVVDTLARADTLTVLTSAHRPGASRGYVYAYAASPLTHRAIAHDFLIGVASRFDAVSASSYGIEALAFGSPQVAQGAHTDLDSDGVRDLNGIEYDAVPDTLLVPRFFGQSAALQSQLILISLVTPTGFSTIVDFLYFNDNEVPVSGQHEFSCWKRLPLLDINGTFDDDFLQSLDHAANEIAGWSFEETGWFEVDGLVATQGAQVIPDPAVLAFLVETRGRSSAETPYGLGTQTGGGLLGPAQPPTCNSTASLTLWPPTHQIVPVDLTTAAGVVDPAGLALTIQITSITQDEPINGPADGNTVCDGSGIGTSVAQLRAERIANGNGRVYKVHYTTTNSASLSCSGVLTVTVPRFQNGAPAVDDGQVQDSTEGCP